MNAVFNTDSNNVELLSVLVLKVEAIGIFGIIKCNVHTFIEIIML